MERPNEAGATPGGEPMETPRGLHPGVLGAWGLAEEVRRGRNGGAWSSTATRLDRSTPHESSPQLPFATEPSWNQNWPWHVRGSDWNSDGSRETTPRFFAHPTQQLEKAFH